MVVCSGKQLHKYQILSIGVQILGKWEFWSNLVNFYNNLNNFFLISQMVFFILCCITSAKEGVLTLVK